MRRLPLLRNATLATRAAVTLLLVIAGVFAIGGGLTYWDARRQALAQELDKLQAYSADVAGEQERRFQRLSAAHRHATELLVGELSGNRDRLGPELLDELYPKHPDGTRRTAPGLFDGQQTRLGYLRGLGGFVANEPDEGERERLIAATRVLHAVGEGLRPDLKTMNYYTPNNTLVMFAPDRIDKLLYYRRDAPATLDFRGREFIEITRPEVNPSGQTRCTSLQPILYDTSRKTWTTGCMTAIHLDGQYVGAWGTTVLLDDLIAESHFSGLPSADVVIVSREGRLIRHPRFTHQNTAATERYLDLRATRDPELRALWSFVQQQRAGDYLGHVPALRAYVSMRRIGTPGWYALAVQPQGVVEAAALRPLQRVALTAALCLVLLAALVIGFLKRQVGRPLQRLSARAAALADSFARMGQEPELIEDRTLNEVRQMELHFSVMADQILHARMLLENRVSERTEALAKANDELSRLAHCDPLTGASNRRRLAVKFEELASGSPRSVIGSALVFDVDHFKAINDRHGHQLGDQVLIRIVQVAGALLRGEDLLARIGGEEFFVLLPGSDETAARRVAERIRTELAAIRIAAEGGVVSFTVSVGTALINNGDTLESLYRRADAALYRAKQLGRNRVEPSLEHLRMAC